MPNSLLTGVSGLLAHQRMLDVVGHNLANMNTTAFKSQRILFADLLYETIQPATSASESGSGGTNPNQIGGGVKTAITDRQFGQGALENTGGALDFAISGGGFFSLTDGTQDFYTRAGAFTIDEEGYLVAPGGLYLQRFSSAGEPDGINPGFQVPGDSRIQIPIGAPIEGVISTEVKVTGNLNATSDLPLAQVRQTLNPFLTGGANASGATVLNDLDSVSTPYSDGDIITIEGLQSDGSQVFAEFSVTSTSTLQDLVNAIGAEYADATVSIESGRIVIESNDTGASLLNLSLRNNGSNLGGGIEFFQNPMILETEGQSAGTASLLRTVYDAQGGEHELALKFIKKDDDTWSMQAVMDPSEGVILEDTIDNIMFSDSGEFLGSENPSITLQINGIAIPQTLTFDFGSSADAERLTHFASDSSLTADGDGSAPGALVGVQVDGNGEVTGIASNGKTFSLAKLAITGFANSKGLVARGNNLYVASLNSGQPEIGEAGSGGRGTISGGQLEASNVDVATEFTKLIVAQTGYNANARTISVSAELLEELTNIIR